MELAKDKPNKLLLMMIFKVTRLFPLAESESFRDFVHFLRYDAPKKGCATMRRRLYAMYEKEFQKLKERLDHNTGKLPMNIDDWRSGTNLDFLGITWHFYNDKFELENHILGSNN